MKPIRLKIKGLNSFVEEQTIDFTELTKQGFFGIFGPTGSGKSTILDAMILALYGIKAMSRGTNEFINKNGQSAYISYEFQVSGTQAKTYRAEREFKLTGQGTKAGKCKLVDLTEGEVVLEDSVKGVDKACVDIIGLTADDFMRTVVLPQGKFSEFLRVSGKDRREILERLFRLEEFGKDLEEKINIALKQEQGKKEHIKGQMEAYGLANEDLLREREEQQTKVREELLELQDVAQKAEASYQELTQVSALSVELIGHERRIGELYQSSESIEEKKQLLKTAERAKGILPLLHSYQELKDTDLKYQEEISRLESALTDTQKKYQEAEGIYQQAIRSREEQEYPLRAKIQTGMEVLIQWKQLPQMKERCKELEDKCLLKGEQIKELCRSQEYVEKEVNKCSAEILSLEAMLEEFKITPEHREGVEQGVVQQAALSKIKEKVFSLEKKRNECRIQIQEEEKAMHQRAEQRKRLSVEMNLYRQELDEIQADTEKVQILKLSQSLEDGKPCPVCGSLHHIRQADQGEEKSDGAYTTNLLKAKELEGKLEDLTKQMRHLETQDHSRAEVTGLFQEQWNSYEAELTGSKEEYNNCLNELEALKTELLTPLELDNFQAAKKQIQEKDKKREKTEQELSAAKIKLREGNEGLHKVQAELDLEREEEVKLQLKIAPIQNMMQDKIKEMEEKIGRGIEPERYVESLKVSLDQLLSAGEHSRSVYESSKEELQAIQLQLNQQQGQQKGNAGAYDNAGRALAEEMKTRNFSNMQEVESAALPDTDYHQYEEQIEKYYTDLKESSLKADTVREKLNGRHTTREELTELKKSCDAAARKLDSRKELLGELKQQIKNMKKNLEKQNKLTVEMESMEHQISILEDLKSVTRGKRFVEFMASERLRYISKSASKRLSEITNGNYELETNGEGEFVIRDNKNGGVLRSPATLSGGETFVASLSLALALSAEIQLKGTAPLELFFLDEGFGSLDEELLDVVMNSLERIHHEHLKVGIISHVESVKARVPVRLIITPCESGVSGSKCELEYC